MNLSKLPGDRKLSLCKRYFYAGFALLPFLWAINAVWFMKEAFWRPAFEEQRQLKRYVMMSAAGAVLWLVALITWALIFTAYRSQWGAFAERLSFVLPLGVP